MSAGTEASGERLDPVVGRARQWLRDDPLTSRLLGELTVAAAGIGTFDWDLTTDEMWWDARFAEMFDLPGERTGTGRDFLARVHEDDRPHVETALRASVEDGADYEAEFRVVHRDGTVRWVADRGRTLSDEELGTPVRVLGATHDVTSAVERRLLEERTAGLARRAELVAEVMSELTETLDAEVAVGRLAQLVVPTLADWCIVTLIEDDGSPTPHLRDIGCWHADEHKRPLVEEYANLRLESLRGDSFIHRALTSHESQVVQPGAVDVVREVLKPGRARDILDELAPNAGAVLPVRGRGRTVGLLTLFRDHGHGEFAREELRTCRKVAAAAGLALDTSRLYHAQRRIAEGLQRVMLTEPPAPDHLEIAVRYVPAAEAAQVGGDWYDAFLQSDGATVLVIGDVVGHDVVAAAIMGQLRSMLRGIGVATDAGPAELLRQVDAAIHLLRSRAVASVVVARVEQDAPEVDEGRTTIRWSNAGHPPPMLIRPDGQVEVLRGSTSDLLVGVAPDAARLERTVTVARGSTLLLYTDGLVERRTEGLREGLERLEHTLAELADLPLEQLCDRVLARMLPDQADDDVAIVAVRLHPQDRPRPPAAGEQDVPDGVPADPAS